MSTTLLHLEGSFIKNVAKEIISFYPSSLVFLAANKPSDTTNSVLNLNRIITVHLIRTGPIEISHITTKGL